MRDTLAEQLLGDAMQWDTSTAKEEIGKLRYIAAVKYDGYRNFEPGNHFLESLALWLRHFNDVSERQIAYQFIMNRLVFISETQMDHLVSLLYPHRVMPILLEQTRMQDNINIYKIKRIRNSVTFRVLKRKTLFLGMSDGARIDSFRRKNALNNEQVCVSHDLSREKCERIEGDLKLWLEENHIKSEAKLINIFLVDDFSGSGNSILREKDGKFSGKLVRFFDECIENKVKLKERCIENGPNIFIVTYLASENGINNLKLRLEQFLAIKGQQKINCKILDPLQILNNELKIPQSSCKDDLAFDELLDKYYDDRIEDEHTKTGGEDVKHGYAGCALPLVLCHNCPNNSVFLLWAQIEKSSERPNFKGVFPRISRHLEGR